MERNCIRVEEDNTANVLDCIKNCFELEPVDIKSYSPLTLAFIGDCIFDLVVKTMIVEEGNCSANKLHRKASAIVKAESQALMAEKMLEEGILTEEEENIYRRGRNAKSYTTAKNASVSDYRKATGVEALMGYLYLDNRIGRAVELIHYGVTNILGDN